METLRAVALTREAARRLRAAAGSGRVHSAYARTLNVALDGLDEAGWLSLHGPGPIPSPFGIACPALPLTGIAPGAPVRVEPGAVVVGAALRVRLDGARRCDSRLPLGAPSPPVADCLVWAHAETREGLLPVAASVLKRTALPADPLARLAVPALAGLSAATAERDAAGALAAARGLLGLGPGLTPAGDDCLDGWLAGLWADGPAGRALVRAVGPALLRAAADRTTALSRAFLACAVAGAVAEPVRAFVAAPEAPRLAALLALGATSGADVLAGYLLARAAPPPLTLSPGGGEGTGPDNS